MKKVIFSAIAMMAFVGSSMASGEVEKTDVLKSKTLEMDCKEVQNSTIKEAKVRGMSDEDANKAGFKMYFWCKGENVKDMTFGLQQSN